MDSNNYRCVVIQEKFLVEGIASYKQKILERILIGGDTSYLKYALASKKERLERIKLDL